MKTKWAGLDSGKAWREKLRLMRQMEGDFQHDQKPVSNPTTPAHELQTIAYALLPNTVWQSTRSALMPSPKKSNSRISGGGICVLEAIAAHANTSPGLLAELLDKVPSTSHAFCQNPVTPFLLFEEPLFPVSLPEAAQLALLREADLTPSFAAIMAGKAESANVQEAARLHVSVAGEVEPNGYWQEIVRNHWQEFCDTLTSPPAREEHKDLVEMGLAPSWAVREPVPLPSRPAQYPFLDEWFRYRHVPGSKEETAFLKQIGPQVENKEVLARALRADATPDDLLLLLVQKNTGPGLVMQAIFRHPNTNERVLQAMADPKNTIPTRDLAQHKNAGPKMIAHLLGDTDPTVRRLARRHPNAPPNAAALSHRALALRRFHDGMVSDAPTPFVSFVASLYFGADCSASALAERVESLQWTERLEAVLIVAQNPNALRGDAAGRTTGDLLHHLARDGNRIVRAAAETCLADPAYQFSLWSPGDQASGDQASSDQVNETAPPA